MKLFTFVITLMFFITAANAQLDFVLQYERPKYPDWEQMVNETYPDSDRFLEHAYYAGAAYRLYPFSVRLGFIPELGIHYGNYERSHDVSPANYSIFQVSFALPIQFFPMDLYGDCNCPTFGRQNDFLKKALFLKFVPGVSYQQMDYSYIDEETAQNLSYSLGAGLGLNIALSNVITLAPEVAYHRLFSMEWDGFSAFHEQPGSSDKSLGSRITAGLRFSLYFN